MGVTCVVGLMLLWGCTDSSPTPSSRADAQTDSVVDAVGTWTFAFPAFGELLKTPLLISLIPDSDSSYALSVEEQGDTAISVYRRKENAPGIEPHPPEGAPGIHLCYIMI